MIKKHLYTAIIISLQLSFIVPANAATMMPITDVPLDNALNSANSMFIIDDSASMDYEMLLNNFDDGVVYYNATNGYVRTGAIGDIKNIKTGHLFPRGSAPLVSKNLVNNTYYNSNTNTSSGSAVTDTFFVGDQRPNAATEHVVPPFTAYNHLRSSDYNALFYNPKLVYRPWPKAAINGTETTFSNSSFTAARVHPVLTSGNGTGTTGTTFDLSATYYGASTTAPANASALPSGQDYWTFNLNKNMVVPASINGGNVWIRTVTISREKTCGSCSWGAWLTSLGSWTQITTATTITNDATVVTETNLGGGGKRESKTSIEAVVPYKPATFWQKKVGSSCGSGTAESSAAIDGNTYCKFDVAAMTATSYTLPDGTVISRNAAAEKTNFANWFTYYRSRKQLMAGSMGLVIDNMQNNYRKINIAGVLMHEVPTTSVQTYVIPSNPNIYDLSSTNITKNGRSLMGNIYSFPIAGGTPTLRGMEAGGDIYNCGGGGSNCTTTLGYGDRMENYLINQSSTDGITDKSTAETALRCSSNSAFILTDGYVNQDGLTSTNNIYTKAKAFYDNMRSWNSVSGNTMNTFAITLGAKGTIYNGDSEAVPTPPATGTDPYAAEVNTNGIVVKTRYQKYAELFSGWPTPVKSQSTTIDDLWRATLYSRGLLLTATDAASLDSAISEVISSMFKSGSDTNVAVSTPNITANDKMAVLSSYNSGSWTGELKAYNLNLTTGEVDTTTEIWSAKEALTSRAASSRVIATSYLNGEGTFVKSAFNVTSLSSIINRFALNSSDGADVINYIRGDRTKEGAGYRKRAHLLGDIVNSTPLFVTGAAANYSDVDYQRYKTSIKNRTKTIYVGANDGMLHAFDAATGAEKWAYVPGLLHTKLKNLANPAYTHEYTVNGKLASWDVKFADGTWHTILIGGLREGGKGFFALDITNPDITNEETLASKVLWEYSGSTNEMGFSFGNPYIAQLSNGTWAVMFTSGYNNISGKGHLYVLNAETGALIKDIDIGIPDNGSKYDQVGLAQISGLVSNNDAMTSGKVKWVYGGDLNGNVWRFDISASSPENWSYKMLAAGLTAGEDNSNNWVSRGLPITTAPEIGYIDTSGTMPPDTYSADIKAKRLMIFVGTGKLIHSSDYADTGIQSNNGFFAIEDADDSIVIGKGTSDGKNCPTISTCLNRNGLGSNGISLGLNNWGLGSNQTEESGTKAWWNKNRGGTFVDADGNNRTLRGWFFQFSETGKESVIFDPIYINGIISFTTTMKTDSRHTNAGTCEAAYSAIYRVGADKGGTVTQDGVTYTSRQNLGFGIAAGLTVFTIGSKTYGSTQLKGVTTTVSLPKTKPSRGDKARFGWRELTR